MFLGDVLDRIEAGGLDCWSEPDLRAALLQIEVLRGRVDADQALVLAELVRRVRVPEAMFGSKVSPREAQRRTKTAVALGDGSLPGAAEALASGKASLAHVEALAAINDRLPDGAAANMLSLAAVLPPDKFARALQRAALPVQEVADASTGMSSSGGRWFRFSYDGLEGTIVLNGLEAVMDRQWRAAHPDRAEERLDRPNYGQCLAAAAPGRRDGRDHQGEDVRRCRSRRHLHHHRRRPATGRHSSQTARRRQDLPGRVGRRRRSPRLRPQPPLLQHRPEKTAAVRDLSCQFGDCDKPIRHADYHHCIPWAQGGLTDVANEAPTCDGCHDKLTNHGYRLERHNGTTYTYNPDGQLIHQRNNRWQQ